MKLKMIELFSGIGAQKRGFEETDLFEIESVGTSDLDKEVICSYAAIHCGMTTEMIENYDYPSKEEMIETLEKKRIGYDFQKEKPYDWKKLAKRKDKTKGIEKYWLADKLSMNFGDITQIEELPECDILTYSSPCTDLSVSGKQNGVAWTCKDCSCTYNPYDFDLVDRYTCHNCGSENIKTTRSGLLYEVERLLDKMVADGKAPKYLMLENVDALVSTKFRPAFNAWINRLDELGYNTYYQCLDARDCGVPQHRNRIFAISIRKDIDTKKFRFPKPFDGGVRLRDILENDEDVIDRYFLSDEIQKRLQITDPDFVKSVIGTTKPDYRTIGQSDVVHQVDSFVGALLSRDYKQPKQIMDTEQEFDLSGTQLKVVRKLTPKEYHFLMGFKSEDWDRCKAIGASDTQGYKQAGNSICVPCVSLLAEHLFKAQYDESYECTDENFTKPQD